MYMACNGGSLSRMLDLVELRNLVGLNTFHGYRDRATEDLQSFVCEKGDRGWEIIP